MELAVSGEVPIASSNIAMSSVSSLSVVECAVDTDGPATNTNEGVRTIRIMSIDKQGRRRCTSKMRWLNQVAGPQDRDFGPESHVSGQEKSRRLSPQNMSVATDNAGVVRGFVGTDFQQISPTAISFAEHGTSRTKPIRLMKNFNSQFSEKTVDDDKNRIDASTNNFADHTSEQLLNEELQETSLLHCLDAFSSLLEQLVDVMGKHFNKLVRSTRVVGCRHEVYGKSRGRNTRCTKRKDVVSQWLWRGNCLRFDIKALPGEVHQPNKCLPIGLWPERRMVKNGQTLKTLLSPSKGTVSSKVWQISHAEGA